LGVVHWLRLEHATPPATPHTTANGETVYTLGYYVDINWWTVTAALAVGLTLIAAASWGLWRSNHGTRIARP
jgi:hypothetical protein